MSLPKEIYIIENRTANDGDLFYEAHLNLKEAVNIGDKKLIGVYQLKKKFHIEGILSVIKYKK